MHTIPASCIAATVKPGRISRRRNLNSWKREREEEEETGERASNGGNGGKRNGEGERERMRNKRREREKEETRLGSFVPMVIREDNADKS